MITGGIGTTTVLTDRTGNLDMKGERKSFLKNLAADTVFIAVSIFLFFLVSTYMQIKTGVANIDIHFRYAFLGFVSLLGGPVAGGLTGLFGHILGQLFKGKSLISGWIFGSGILGFLQGYLFNRIISKEATMEGSQIPLQEHYEKLKKSFGQKRFHVFFVLIIFGTNFVVWPLIVPLLELILNGADFWTQLLHGAYAALSNSLTAIVVTEVFMSSMNYKAVRRIVSVLLIVNSLVIFSYARRDTGALFLYGMTLLFALYMILNDIIVLGIEGKFMSMFRRFLIVVAMVSLVISLFLFVNAYRRPCTGEEKVLIVLGAGLNGEKPSTLLQERLDKAYEYAMEHPEVVIVVSGGQGDDEIVSEAEAMRNYLLEKGVEEDRVFKEDRSTTTEENFRFSVDVLRRHGLDISHDVALVTNTFHCFRASLYGEKAGFQGIRILPAKTPVTGIFINYLREGPAMIKYLLTYR